MRINDFDGFVNERLVLLDYWQYAKLVVEAYDEAPQFDQSATKHWDALLVSSKNWYKKIMSDIKIEIVDSEPYNSAQEMRERVDKEKVMYLDQDYKDHPYWSDDEFRLFRCVHDYIVHVKGYAHDNVNMADFSLKGEMSATNLHMRIIPEMAKPALFMEIPGNVCNYIIKDEFPAVIKIAKLEGFDFNDIGKVKGYLVDQKRLVRA